MGVQIQCPHCGQTYALNDQQIPQYAGQTINCTQCGKAFTVPPDLASIAMAPAPTSTLPPPQYSPSSAPGAAPQAGYPPQAQSPAQSQSMQYAPPQYYQQRSNPMAIVSVICGAIGMIIPLIPGILGIIFGILGLRKTRDPAVGGKAVAITGISIASASIFFSFCTISILLPSLNRARETANRVKCAANMRSIGQAMLLYANENRGAFPPTLGQLTLDEDIVASAFVCPSSNDTAATGNTPQAIAAAVEPGTGHLSYLYFGNRMSSGVGANMVLVCEPLSNHSNDGVNVLFGDGRVTFIGRPVAQLMVTQLQAGQNPPPALGGGGY